MRRPNPPGDVSFGAGRRRCVAYNALWHCALLPSRPAPKLCVAMAAGVYEVGSRRFIALTGFMAAGKSTIGKRLARKLQTDFFDLDVLIVARHGPIAAIFENGEPEFRQREVEALTDLFDRAKTGVIALGGGAVTYAPTTGLLRRHAYEIFLDVPLHTIAGRLKKSRTVRPLAAGAMAPTSLEDLFAQRLPRYRQADFTVEAGGRTANETVDAIIGWMKAQSISL